MISLSMRHHRQQKEKMERKKKKEASAKKAASEAARPKPKDRQKSTLSTISESSSFKEDASTLECFQKNDHPPTTENETQKKTELTVKEAPTTQSEEEDGVVKAHLSKDKKSAMSKSPSSKESPSKSESSQLNNDQASTEKKPPEAHIPPSAKASEKQKGDKEKSENEPKLHHQLHGAPQTPSVKETPQDESASASKGKKKEQKGTDVGKQKPQRGPDGLNSPYTGKKRTPQSKKEDRQRPQVSVSSSNRSSRSSSPKKNTRKDFRKAVVKTKLVAVSLNKRRSDNE